MDVDLGIQVVVDLAVAAPGSDRPEVLRVVVLQEAGVVFAQRLADEGFGFHAQSVRHGPLQVAPEAPDVIDDAFQERERQVTPS